MDRITVKQRFGRAAVVGAAGGGVALAMMWAEPHFGLDPGFLRVATAGAFLAGLCVARGFGGQGNAAVFRAGFFFSLATVLGAIFAVLLLPVDMAITQTGLTDTLTGAMTSAFVGPVFVLSMLGEGGAVVALWAVGLVCSYLCALGRAPRPSKSPWG